MPSLHKENGATCAIEWRPKKASVAMSVNDVVTTDSDGYVLRLTAGDKTYGTVLKAVASTDSDYADNTRVPVQVCGENAEYLFDVSTGTAAQTNVGEYKDFEDHNSVDVTASTNDDVLVTDIVSDSVIKGKFANRITNK